MKSHILRRLVFPLVCCLLLLFPAPGVRADAASLEDVRQAILRGYEDLAAADGLTHTIDVSGYGIPLEELKQLVTSTGRQGDCLQPWYLENFSYNYNTETGLVNTVTFRRLDPEVYDYTLFQQKMAEILDATVHEGMSQWQKALSIHDYLVTHCAYDLTYTYRKGYDAIVRGTSVCSGYAEAYMYLLQRVGIDCRYVSSDGMDHGWNVVKINGNWYHVDATWDDPTADLSGRCLHRYFLLSDTAMADGDHNHYGWDTSITCTDTGWDTDRFWHGIDSPICYESADVCYFRRKTGDTGYTVYRRDREGNQTAVSTTDAGYISIAGDGRRRFYVNYGLDLEGDTLYYADMTAVYSVKTDGSEKKTVYAHDYAANRTCILGSRVEGNTLYLTLRDHDGNRKFMELSLGSVNHTHSYTGETIAPTGSQRGYTLFSCECGLSYEADFRPPLQADADDVSEEEYRNRFLLVAAGVLLLIFLFRRRKAKK